MKIDQAKLPVRIGSGYPAPFHEGARGREKRALGRAGGLTDFGVNLVHLPPGGLSSQRHWHTSEDEFVYLIEGELVLVTDAGETPLMAGECAAFPRGKPDGHHMINRSDRTAVYLEVGSRRPEDQVSYPDIDMRYSPDEGYTHKDGTPYPPRQEGS
jgi:uncharacterized cupin superfamily protein